MRPRDAVLVVAAHLRRVRHLVERRVRGPRGDRVHRNPVRAELDGERLRQAEDAALRGHVGGELGDRLDVDDRGDVDDPPAASLRDHLASGGPTAVVVAVQVGGEQAVPVLVGHLEERLHHQARRAVHPDVDPAPRLDRTPRELVDVGGIPGVALEDDRVAPLLADRGRRSFSLGGRAPVVERDVRPRARECDCRRLADPL